MGTIERGFVQHPALLGIVLRCPTGPSESKDGFGSGRQLDENEATSSQPLQRLQFHDVLRISQGRFGEGKKKVF
jgi:hypothetical protein